VLGCAFTTAQNSTAAKAGRIENIANGKNEGVKDDVRKSGKRANTFEIFRGSF
jgi:hypothetical protein